MDRKIGKLTYNQDQKLAALIILFVLSERVVNIIKKEKMAITQG